MNAAKPFGAVSPVVTGVLLLALLATPGAPVAASPQDAAGLTAEAIQNADLEVKTLEGVLGLEVARLGAGGGGVWLGYSVAAVRSDSGMCCHDTAADADEPCGVCRLGTGTGYTRHDPEHGDDAAAVELEQPDAVRVLVRLENGVVDRIKVFSASCVIDAGGRRVVWLDGVPADVSLDWLAAVAGQGSGYGEDAADGAMAAVAMHAGSVALQLMTDWATGRYPRQLRQQAIFWLGAARGTEAWGTLAALVKNDPDSEIRDRAVFAAYVSEEAGAVDLLIDAARHDSSDQVRRSALMWLAHLAGERAVAAIQDAIDDPNTAIKRHAVFALSQLPADEGVPLLIKIVRENANPEVRKQALFWLGQTGDPRALALIEELLLGA
jgi:hypothetical protein